MMFGKRDLGLALSDKIEDNVLTHTHDEYVAGVVCVDGLVLFHRPLCVPCHSLHPPMHPSTHNLRTAADVTEKGLRAKLDPTRKVQRLRPGAMPGWVGDEEEEEGFTAQLPEGGGRQQRRHGEHDDDLEGLDEQVKGEGEEEYVPTQTAHKEDRRLLRLEQARQVAAEARQGRRRAVYEAEIITGGDDEEEQEEDKDAVHRRRRRHDSEDDGEGGFVAGDVVQGGRDEAAGGPVKEEEDDDEDAIARRRAAIRERLKNLRMEEEAAAAAARPEGALAEEEEEDEDEEDDSEYETDTDESEVGGGTLFALPKPVFIPKHKRELVQEREREEKEEAERVRQQELARERRKRDTRNLVAEEVRKEAEGATLEAGLESGYGSDAGAPDDTDKPEDDALEFEGWRLRELYRIKRDRDQRQARAKVRFCIHPILLFHLHVLNSPTHPPSCVYYYRRRPRWNAGVT